MPERNSRVTGLHTFRAGKAEGLKDEPGEKPAASADATVGENVLHEVFVGQIVHQAAAAISDLVIRNVDDLQ